MLQVFDLEKSYGDNLLFSDVNFSIGDGEKVGLVGRNGHGKSTLFKLILGEESYDQGKIVFSKNYQIGYLRQQLNFTQKTVVEEGCLGLPSEERDPQHTDYTYKVEKILLGLGFNKDDFSKSPAELSGGYQVRLNLAKVLVSASQLLLLDEPTNYLDILSLRWLARFLKSWPGEILLITHDREFMDSVATHILGIHRKRVRKIKGKTSDFFQKIAEEEEVYERTRLSEERKIKEIQSFVDKFRAKARQGSLVQSRIKMLSKMESKTQLAAIPSMDFTFTYTPFNGKWPLAVKELFFHYTPDFPLINNLSFSVSQGDKLAIIGKNGKGKTTLLNILAQKIPPISGKIEKQASVRLAYFEQTNREMLSPNLTIEEEIRLSNSELPYTRLRGICGTMMFSNDDAQKPIRILSGGEKSRVLLGKILATPSNLLLLDEPTNHLDLESTLSLIKSLQKYEGTIIIVTHNEMMLRNIPNKFLVYQKDKIEFFDGTYDDFLNKGGFEEEEQSELKSSSSSNLEDKSESKSGSTLSAKEGRLLKKEIMSERARTLNPLKEKINKLEERILDLEESLENINNQLIACSQSGPGQGDKISALSISYKETQKNLDDLYSDLEKMNTEYEKNKEEFELRLAVLGG